MNNFEIKPMKIEVERSNPDTMLESWVRSKNRFLYIDYDNKKVINKENGQSWDLDDYRKQVFDMDLGFAYMDFAKFTMTTSIALREYFYTFMEYNSKWATTNRYGLSDSIVISEEMYEPGITEDAVNKFVEIRKLYDENKILFDKARPYTPIACQVTYQMGMPIKQFMKYVAAAYIHFHDKLPQLWQGLWTACMGVPDLKPWMKRFLKYSCTEEIYKYCLHDNNVYSDEQLKCNFKNYGELGMILYSHLIRHESTICLGYIDFLKDLKNNKELHNCRLQFPVQVFQSKIRELEMIKVRSSWFCLNDDWSDHNSWGYILSNYFKDGAKIEDNKKYFKFFDSEGNFDRASLNQFSIDEALKVFKGYKSNFPDPFLLEYKDLIRQRAEKSGWSPLLHMYEQLFELGYVKDNPDNPYRKKWIELNGESK